MCITFAIKQCRNDQGNYASQKTSPEDAELVKITTFLKNFGKN